MRLLGGGEGDGMGMKMVCGEVQIPKVAVGMAPKDFFFQQTSILLPEIFHNMGLLMGSCRQNWEGSTVSRLPDLLA